MIAHTIRTTEEMKAEMSKAIDLLYRQHPDGMDPLRKMRSAGYPLRSLMGNAVLASEMGMDTFTQMCFNLAVMEYGPWDVANYMDDGFGLPVALVQAHTQLDEILFGPTPPVCLCGRNFANPDALPRHQVKCHTYMEENSEMTSAVPTHPSNQTFLKQLRLWGVEEVKRRGDTVTMHFPDGSKMQLPTERTHKGAAAKDFADAYRILGVSPAMFWAGPAKEDDPTPADAPPEKVKGPNRKRHQGYVNKVTDYLVQQGCPVSIDRIAEDLGITKAQASSACSRLTILTVAERLKSGVYVATQYAANYRVGVDVTVGAREPEKAAEAPQEAEELPADHPSWAHNQEAAQERALRSVVPIKAVRVGPDEDDEVIDDMLMDLLEAVVPDGIPPRKMRSVIRWQEETRLLLRELSE